MISGYTGVVLRVDLTADRIETDTFSEKTLREYVGGSGLGARVLFDETDPACDPLGPGNLLIFMTGPLVGTRTPSSGRHAMVAKSPLTGLWGEADAGGHWGATLKMAGYDGIIVSGMADRPVYLSVTDESVAIRDASDLWGMDTYEIETALGCGQPGRAVVCAIGPAGEKGARIASVMNDGRAGRAAGRTGLGAVMGSKRLKAIVVEGSRQVQVADPDALRSSIKEIAPAIVQFTKGLHEYGTAAGVEGAAVLGDLPTQNWRIGQWLAEDSSLLGEALASTIAVGRYYCHSCFIGCGRVVKIEEGPSGPIDGAGPEYESIGAFGSMCLVDDMEAVARAHEMCNRYGLDVISTGSAIAFAMEAYEKGLISEHDLDGLELRWGDPVAMLRMVHMIGRREGLGELLGEGVRRAAETIGDLSKEFAVHVKGLELPYHDPRALSSLAVAYATHPRGACHRGMSHLLERMPLPDLGYEYPLDRFEPEGKGIATAVTQDLGAIYNSLKLCHFIIGPVTVGRVADWLNCVTGWDFDTQELLEVGTRIQNLTRLYNFREGCSRKDDSLPPRIATLSLKEGGAAGRLPHLGRMLSEYYHFRGWSEEGLPLAQTLAELGLSAEISYLPKHLGSQNDTSGMPKDGIGAQETE